MNNLLNQVLSHDWVIKILDHPYAAYVYNLSSREVWIIIIVSAALILFLAYRRLGAGAFFGLILVFALAYIVYSTDIYGRWTAQQADSQKSLDLIEAELEK